MNTVKKARGQTGHGNGHGNGHGEIAARGTHALAALQREVDRAFHVIQRALGGGKSPKVGELARWPAVDVTEDDMAVILRADVPGIDAKDLDVEVSGNLLTIRGTREEEHEEEKHGYHRHERRSGSFSRTVTLPPYVKGDKIEARYDKGVLVVMVPKIPGQGPKRVTVKAG